MIFVHEGTLIYIKILHQALSLEICFLPGFRSRLKLWKRDEVTDPKVTGLIQSSSDKTVFLFIPGDHIYEAAAVLFGLKGLRTNSTILEVLLHVILKKMKEKAGLSSRYYKYQLP